MADPEPNGKPNLDPQQYAVRLLQMLQDFGEEFIKVDSVILVVKMLTRHPIENAILFATGDAYQFGAYEFESHVEVQSFLDQTSENVIYAAFQSGAFKVFRYPYRSRVIDEWVFVDLEN